MKIIPVLDLLNGVVVRGVAGERAVYQPVVSCLTDNPAPLSVARAIREKFGLNDFYVADLDAIQFSKPNWQVYRQLSADGCRLMIDAGVSDVRQASDLLAGGAVRVIVGLESCRRPDLLKSLCEACGRERITFSLDLKGGIPFGDTSGWGTDDPETIGRQAIDAGIGSLIVLDLAQVGRDEGLSTLALCNRLQAFGVPLITGGGVRGVADLNGLQDQGIAGVLVASILHDGRVTAEDLLPFLS